jgi:hypothetical protein
VLARRDGDAWALTATNNGDAPSAVEITLPDDAPGAWADALSGDAAKVEAVKRTLALTVPARFGRVLVNGDGRPPAP